MDSDTDSSNNDAAPEEPVSSDSTTGADVTSGAASGADAEKPSKDPFSLQTRLAVIGAAVGILLLVAVAAFAYVQNRVGSAEDALAAVPADSTFVMSIDLRHFSGDRFDRLLEAVEPFLEEADPSLTSWEDALDELDAMFEAETGLTLSDDVFPWIGRSIAFGFRGVTPEGEPEGMIVAVSLQDENGAHEFIETLAAQSDTEIERRSVAGASRDAYLIADEIDDQVWVVIENDLLILALNQAGLEESLAVVDSGGSIVDDDAYRTLVDELPDDRGFRLFVSGDAFTDLILEAQGALGDLADEEVTEIDSMDIPDFAMAAGLTDLGIAIDVVAEVDDTIADLAIGPPPLGSALPGDTVLYLGFAAETDPPTIGELLREFDESMFDEIESVGGDFLGLGSLVDLLDHLTPELGLAVTPRPGAMPTTGALPIDVSAILALGIDDREAVVAIVDEVVGLLTSMGLTIEAGDDVWEVFVDSEEPLLVWTVTDDAILVATDGGTLDRFETSADGDDTPDVVRQLDGALPGDGLAFFLDVDGMADLVTGGSGDAGPFAGFEAVAAGIELRGSVQHAGILVKIADPPDGN